MLALAFTLLLHEPRTVIADSSAHAHGAELFATRGCAHCHGKDGVNGDLGPDLQRIRDRMTAAQIAMQIHDGSKSMPAFGDQLTAAETQDIVIYLRTKRKKFIQPQPPPIASPKPDPDGGF
jgi:mono/diheme cytochrome c family protein